MRLVGGIKTVKPPLNSAKTVTAPFHAFYISQWLCVADEGLIIFSATENNGKLIPLPVIRWEKKAFMEISQELHRIGQLVRALSSIL